MDNYKFYQIREKFSNESKDTVQKGSNKDESTPTEETKISKNSIPLNYLIVSSVFIVILIIIFLYFKTFM